MAEAEIVREDFSFQNPLKFKSHPPGSQLYWANRIYRSEHRGFGRLRPIRTTDSDFEAVKACLEEPPLDLDLQGETVVKRGDLMLCRISEDDAKRNARRREYLANRKIEALKKGDRSMMQEELSRVRDERGSGSKDIRAGHSYADRPEFKEERPVTKSGYKR